MIGLGYVGLPLAVALSAHFDVVGYDVDARRVTELAAGHDRTGEVDEARLKDAVIDFCSGDIDLEPNAGTAYIVTVPTPVDAQNEPDLSVLLGACRTVGSVLAPGDLVVVESTVYPGVTADLCAPVLEESSGLAWRRDFHLGYSPERINPGDSEHTLARIVKVVSGDTPETADRVAAIYRTICAAGVHIASSIETAEAAKAIENAQRDINIAFVNEVAMIAASSSCQFTTCWRRQARSGISCPSLRDWSAATVLVWIRSISPTRLARSDTNRRSSSPGRRINDAMGDYLAGRVDAALGRKGRILVLG